MSNASQFYGSKPFRGMTLKAWVKFTGSTGAILSSFNVTSLTRTAIGTYDIVFTNAMTGTTFMIPISQVAVNHTSIYDGAKANFTTRTTTTGTIGTSVAAGTATDFGSMYLEIWE
jgi:hypothetical protein